MHASAQLCVFLSLSVERNSPYTQFFRHTLEQWEMWGKVRLENVLWIRAKSIWREEGKTEKLLISFFTVNFQLSSLTAKSLWHIQSIMHTQKYRASRHHQHGDLSLVLSRTSNAKLKSSLGFWDFRNWKFYWVNFLRKLRSFFVAIFPSRLSISLINAAVIDIMWVFQWEKSVRRCCVCENLLIFIKRLKTFFYSDRWRNSLPLLWSTTRIWWYAELSFPTTSVSFKYLRTS